MTKIEGGPIFENIGGVVKLRPELLLEVKHYWEAKKLRIDQEPVGQLEKRQTIKP